MASSRPRPACVGSPAFDPVLRTKDPSARAAALARLEEDDLEGAIKAYFQLPARDTYVYHAMVSITLHQAQEVVALGGRNGLHAWYWRLPSSPLSPPEPLPPPPPADIAAYLALFDPATTAAAALRGLSSNAKKGSIRASVAAHLLARRFVHPALERTLAIPRNRTSAPANPYLDFWAWSSRRLEWCGPCPESEGGGQRSHHVLPILMHHFGCAVPSYEALEVLRVLAGGRPVADIGSGGGYWAFMLRAHGVAVVPVDSAQSEWRVSWVGDTVIADGAKWLGRRENDGGRGMVLLMVYPVVGGGVAGGVEGGFTRGLMAAYKGDTVAVVGTQNRNGYTGFRDMTMDEYMEREQKDWTKIVQIPLPSFAGKDEALFIFQRGDRAPKKEPPSEIKT
ncbi:Transcription factor nrm1 whi5 [Pleurostoma richardsiae]|uniref:Transcription factor nrm1 whi5 n=1 Tax=Pleurostoma richardsiae TaxID=41990 RepID=A0AA38RS54_9PEZI|nr:Transcription factor nrm1 whi5 [Pleurostoma richardsiae]